jgi:hypothetical protein
MGALRLAVVFWKTEHATLPFNQCFNIGIYITEMEMTKITAANAADEEERVHIWRSKFLTKRRNVNANYDVFLTYRTTTKATSKQWQKKF